MSYGIKYQTTFDRVDKTGVDLGYTLQILQKDYSGSVTDVIAGGVPVVQSYQTDEAKPPIKGSSLTISLLNIDNTLPLTSFFSTNDDEFQVQLFWGVQLMWIGYVVQDDCNEILVDFTHEIVLSANDNLGLLKDVSLDKAPYETFILGGSYNVSLESAAPHFILQPDLSGPMYQAGWQIVVSGTLFDGTYTIVSIDDQSGGRIFIIAETVATNFIAVAGTIDYYVPDMYALRPLLTYFHNCLSATNIAISTNLFCNFQEISQNYTISFSEQTELDPQMFLKDDNTYQDCYTVLQYILDRFNCTLFQARGYWQIVHWDEVRYYGYEIPGFQYDSDFNLVGPVILNDKSTGIISFPGFNEFQVGIGEDTQAETGLNHRILRPFLFAKETFNYRQPRQIFRNFDLQTLGDLLSSTTTGSGPTLQTINDYVATWFDPSTRPDAGSGTYLIRVILDNLNNEIDRLLVVTHDVISQPIAVSAGDAFKYSFTFKTEDSQPGNINLVMYVELYDGTTTNYYHEDGTWQTGVGFVYNIPSGDNSNQWHTVTIDSSNFPIPYDGVIFCYLRIMDLSGTVHETYYKDIRFEYIALINESTKIIGQTHQNTQYNNIKLNGDKEIFIDDSPRNSFAGAMFLPTATGLLQDRTVQWFLNDVLNPHKLGQLTTFETLFWRRIVRSILEGTYYGLVSADSLGNHISMLGVFNYTFFPGLNFIFGKLDIDYRNNRCTGTLWEIWDGTEVDSDLTATYLFNYLYALK